MQHQPTLLRRLTTTDAVVIGLGAMIGAGVFAAFGPAAQAAGAALLVALGLAAAVAYCNAVASAQLAAAYPSSGGTYHFGRERLNEWWGFTAGWGFVIGKTASCAAMAITVAAYAAPDGPWWLQRLIAVAVIAGLTALNYRGITKTAGMTRVLVTLTLLALGTVVVAILFFGNPELSNLTDWAEWRTGGVYGTLQAAGLLFFAFAGYARIATLSEEVRDPEITIPRAIPIALGITVAVYAVIAVTILAGAGVQRIADSAAPLVTAVEVAGVEEVAFIVRIGGMVAATGALLALIAGVGRTALAMARNHDLPSWLAAVHPEYRVPHHAEVTLAVVVSVIVLMADLRGAIGFSSFGVLIYYAIANAAAFTQTGKQRRWPRSLNVAGLMGCAILVVTLPLNSILAGVAMFAVGLGGRLIIVRRRTLLRSTA